MNGRLEKEIQEKNKILGTIKNYPLIFQTFYNWLDAREKSYLTIKNYIRHVHEFMTSLSVDKRDDLFYEKVTEEDIDAYMSSIKLIKTKNGYRESGDDIRAAKWSSLNTFFYFLIQKKYIKNNPMIFTERPKNRTDHNITFLTPKEIQSIFQMVKKNGTRSTINRDLCIFSLGISTGLRVSAMMNINVEDIDFNNNIIRVIEKGKKTRMIKFGSNFKTILENWMIDRNTYYSKEQTGPLFLSRLKNRLSVDSAEEMVEKYTKHLNKKITPHKLRSTAAMNLLDANVDIVTVADMLGHEQITTTQRYVKAYESRKNEAVNILDKLI